LANPDSTATKPDLQQWGFSAKDLGMILTQLGSEKQLSDLSVADTRAKSKIISVQRFSVIYLMFSFCLQSNSTPIHCLANCGLPLFQLRAFNLDVFRTSGYQNFFRSCHGDFGTFFPG